MHLQFQDLLQVLQAEKADSQRAGGYVHRAKYAGGFGAGFGPLVICSLFWKRTTLPGAIAGMVAGGAMVFIWKYLVKPLDGVFGVYELLPAFLVGLLVIVIVSLCTKAPARDVMDEFERARSNEIL